MTDIASMLGNPFANARDWAMTFCRNSSIVAQRRTLPLRSQVRDEIELSPWMQRFKYVTTRCRIRSPSSNRRMPVLIWVSRHTASALPGVDLVLAASGAEYMRILRPILKLSWRQSSAMNRRKRTTRLNDLKYLRDGNRLKAHKYVPRPAKARLQPAGNSLIVPVIVKGSTQGQSAVWDLVRPHAIWR